MIHGVCWDVGQSTLSRRLAAVIPDVDVLWEDELSQPAIFTRAEFSDVADRFHRHNANPAAGIGNPPALMLEDAYRRLVQTALDHGRPTLMGWSIMDLAEDLDWAWADERALHHHSRTVREILAPLDPILICIDGNIAAAFTRAVEQRGRDWFTRQQADTTEWQALRNRLLSEASIAARRVNRAFEAGGWYPTLHVDGTTRDADDVFYTVVEYLRRHGLPITANEDPQRSSP